MLNGNKWTRVRCVNYDMSRKTHCCCHFQLFASIVVSKLSWNCVFFSVHCDFFCVCVCVRRSIPFRLDRLSYVVHTRACFAHFKLKRYNDFCEVHILKEIQTQCGMNKRQKTDLNARLFRLWRLWWNTIDEAKRTTLNEWMAAVLSIELKMDTNSIGIGW